MAIAERSARTRPLRVALRTYTLALSLSLAPAILPVLTSPTAQSPRKVFDLLRRELSPTAFAFAMTLAIGGGKALDQLWESVQHRSTVDESQSSSGGQIHMLSAPQRTFLANILSCSAAATLLTFTRHSRHIPTASIPLTVTPPPRGSPTLDLTLLLFVRALDARLQTHFRQPCMHETDVKNKNGQLHKYTKRWLISNVSSKLDALIFWLACSRIMWCFFYQPDRLPRSYVKWITSLAAMDPRLLVALRAIRGGKWIYGRSSPYNHLTTSMASDLNLNPLWGDPKHLPAHGGADANRAWATLGVQGRNGVGGIPCQIVHCGVAGNSCTGNALFRGVRAFGQALLIYTPVHIVPPLLTNPTRLFTDPFPIIFALLRSASFLSAFVSSIWYTVCFVRTLFVPRYLPRISHNFLDGPQGCILAGCLVCGVTIGLERKKRRGEIALYVLPRAIRACLPDVWVKSSSWRVRSAERIVFVLSLASILTSAIHRPNSLRGLSRWTLEYIMSGTNSGFWKKGAQNGPL